MLQPAASIRPVITNRSCTPPSRVVLSVPSGLGTNLNRASRTGPFAVTKKGIVLVAPFRFATVNSGLVEGLVPPVAGCAWQPAQVFRLNLGPSPEPASPATVPLTESISKNLFWP